ncbi:MAG TPA: glycerol-3-phosphate dehydrogenase [Methyloceanibacter sp.]|nr:glycerol-3-phosphate dehydrogenase [Methyloceanibacter sp.]
MATESFDILIVGGGIHGAAVARDAAGRGLKVLLAEKGDYASATSSASSKLIHGGLRYLEHLELKLVRESLVERAELLRAAPHLVAPLKFLLPIYNWQMRKAWTIHAGLALYDLLSMGDGLPASGRLSSAEAASLPRLRQDNLSAVLRYHDCQTDDARLTLAVALDARTRGADILNRRAVTAITALENGYAVDLDERGQRRRVETRFIVNAAGPFAPQVDALTEAAPEPHPLQLIRGSHIVLPMPDPPALCAYTLQDEGERIVFVIPWLDARFLIVGTTDVPHYGDPGTAHCSADEKAYLVHAYNRYFTNPGRTVTERDIVFTWSGVRALHGDPGEKKPSRISRSPSLAACAQGTGGFITLYGGKLTTHRALAEDVLFMLNTFGLKMSGPWTKDVPLHGGSMSRPALLARAEQGPAALPLATRQRWALTYGDKIEDLFARVASDSAAAEEIAPGLPRAELDYAVDAEDAMTAEDLLLRRTKLHLLLDEAGREAVREWFAKA